MTTFLAQNQFLNSPTSFPAVGESGATVENAPAPAVAPEPIEACGSQETTAGDSAACDLLVGLGGAPAQERPLTHSAEEVMLSAGSAGVIEPASPVMPAAPISHSCGGDVIASAASSELAIYLQESAVIDPVRDPVAAVLSPVTMAPAPVGVSVCRHNEVTHAVEIRPLPLPQIPADAAAPDQTNHIGEIFVGARRLPQRELPPDFHARLLEAIETDAAWADEPPLFLRRDV